MPSMGQRGEIFLTFAAKQNENAMCEFCSLPFQLFSSEFHRIATVL